MSFIVKLLLSLIEDRLKVKWIFWKLPEWRSLLSKHRQFHTLLPTFKQRLQVPIVRNLCQFVLVDRRSWPPSFTKAVGVAILSRKVFALRLNLAIKLLSDFLNHLEVCLRVFLVCFRDDMQVVLRKKRVTVAMWVLDRGVLFGWFYRVH